MPERFNISANIDTIFAKVMAEVMPRVQRLPEDVTVIYPTEIETAPKPFVVVTTRPTVAEAAKAYQAGAYRYLTMTFDKEDLIKRLEGIS